MDVEKITEEDHYNIPKMACQRSLVYTEIQKTNTDRRTAHCTKDQVKICDSEVRQNRQKDADGKSLFAEKDVETQLKKRRLPPPYEGIYTIIMPSGTCPRTRKILANPRTQQILSRRGFEPKRQSVFSRLDTELIPTNVMNDLQSQTNTTVTSNTKRRVSHSNQLEKLTQCASTSVSGKFDQDCEFLPGTPFSKSLDLRKRLEVNTPSIEPKRQSVFSRLHTGLSTTNVMDDLQSQTNATVGSSRERKASHFNQLEKLTQCTSTSVSPKLDKNREVLPARQFSNSRDPRRKLKGKSPPRVKEVGVKVGENEPSHDNDSCNAAIYPLTIENVNLFSKENPLFERAKQIKPSHHGMGFGVSEADREQYLRLQERKFNESRNNVNLNEILEEHTIETDCSYSSSERKLWSHSSPFRDVPPPARPLTFTNVFQQALDLNIYGPFKEKKDPLGFIHPPAKDH